MLNGRLYDAGTLNEIGNHPRPRLPFWFESVEPGVSGKREAPAPEPLRTAGGGEPGKR
jgi:hypothetical protein